MRSSNQEILSAYVEVAESIRDGEFYVRCAQRKSYLTREVLARWHIGQAPTLGQCKAAGVTENELRLVGLYITTEYGDRPFFRDSMIFPFMENGQIVYLASRRLVDHDPKTGEPLSKSAKALSMRAPGSNGEGGVLLDTGFNIGALNQAESVMLVEGPLDAIACSERGHPAIAMVGKCPRPGLLAILRKSTIPIYLALDGTADVVPEERLEIAARVGPGCWILELPQGSDPDDMAADDLVALKAGATQCLEAWLQVFRQPPKNWKKDAAVAFRSHLRKWLSDSDTSAEGDLRARVCGALGLQNGEWDQLIGATLDSAGGIPGVTPNAACNGKGRLELSEDDRTFIDVDLKGRLISIQPLEGIRRDEAVEVLLRDLAGHLISASAIVKERARSLTCEFLRLSKGAYDSGLREARVGLGLSGASGNGEDWMVLARRYLDEIERDGFCLAS